MSSRPLKPIILLASIVASVSPVHAGGNAGGGQRFELAAPPPGFEELEQAREILVDVHFGGRKIGEARIVARPGFVRFHDAKQVVSLIPSLKDTAEITAFLAEALPANSNLACAQTNSHRCGELSPELAGIIFDEERFRVDLFVHPDLLETRRPSKDVYLDSPAAPFSLTSSVGLVISGSSGSPATYNLQNRTIAGYRNLRVRSDSSLASKVGFIFDDLVAELDTGRHRYSAGLFWAPGLDFTGRRRIVGAGVATQFDTRADRETLGGTPLIVFLSQPARVEILIDGRLVTSSSYEAGNNLIDTSSLPSGSYQLVVRIRDAGGATRDERRFFVKNAQIPPVGEPVYFAYAGVLANTRSNRPISLSKTFFYQLGTARRLSDRLAVDAALLGTQQKVLAEAGAWLMTPHARLRAAGLMSSSGDNGVILQLGSAGGGMLNFNFDIRRVWSGDGTPLIPLAPGVDNFGSAPPTGAQVADGSYSEASGSVGYSVGRGYLAVTGSYRRARGLPADYSIGPSVTWPVLNRHGLQLVMQADAQQTRSFLATFVGFRLLYTSGGLSMLSSGGHGSIRRSDGSGASASRGVSSLSAQWSYQHEDSTQASLGAGIEKNVDSTSAHVNGLVNSRFGSVRGDLLREFGKGRNGMQYGLTFQSGAAAAGRVLELGVRELNESALIASVNGTSGDALFEILVDELPRGKVRAGGSVPIFLQAYRSYKVRLRPIGSPPVHYDSRTREITLYPGNVEHLRWDMESLVTLFGQVVRADGRPVSNAMVQTRRGIGQTDLHGYFQIDATAADSLVLTGSEGASCEILLSGLTLRSDYASIGKVTCR